MVNSFKDRLEYLSELEELRRGWNDEIPDEIIDSTSYEKTKARTAWFTCVSLLIELGTRDGYNDNDTEERHSVFFDRVKHIHGSNRATRGDIEAGNILLDYVIGHVRNSSDFAAA